MITINSLLDFNKEDVIKQVEEKLQVLKNSYFRYDLKKSDIYSAFKSVIENIVDEKVNDINIYIYENWTNGRNTKLRQFKLKYILPKMNIIELAHINFEITCYKDTNVEYGCGDYHIKDFKYNFSTIQDIAIDKEIHQAINECLQLKEEKEKALKEYRQEIEFPKFIEEKKQLFDKIIKAMESKESIDYRDICSIKSMFSEYEDKYL